MSAQEALNEAMVLVLDDARANIGKEALPAAYLANADAASQVVKFSKDFSLNAHSELDSLQVKAESHRVLGMLNQCNAQTDSEALAERSQQAAHSIFAKQNSAPTDTAPAPTSTVKH